LHVPVRSVALTELRRPIPAESSAAIAARIVDARARQAARLAPYGLACNAELTTAAQRATCALDARAEAALAALHKARRGMSARAVDRVIRVARTIADLMGAERIDAECIFEAGSYRALDAEPAGGGLAVARGDGVAAAR